MIARRMGRNKKPTVQIVPLIDIIFSVLVFFMLATTFKTHPAGLNLELPRAASYDRQASSQITISIAKDGRMFLGERQVNTNTLRSEVKSALDKRPDLFVIIKADREARYDYVVQVMDVVRQLGGYRFGLAVEPRGR
ncbi:MAG TPA: biopolymer transporter ExbD [Firmicutes bacterium]|nr:biopolymer transporter ExbD [Bacillota bacterium]